VPLLKQNSADLFVSACGDYMSLAKLLKDLTKDEDKTEELSLEEIQKILFE